MSVISRRSAQAPPTSVWANADDGLGALLTPVIAVDVPRETRR